MEIPKMENARLWFKDKCDMTGRTVLDAGCGGAYLLPKLLELGAAHVVAADDNPNAIDEVRKAIDTLQLQDKAEGVVTDLSHPGSIPDESADVIILNYVLPAVDEEDFDGDYRILRNLFRVLRSGGDLFLLADASDIGRADNSLAQEYIRISSAFYRMINEATDDDVHLPLHWTTKWLQECGFLLRESSQVQGAERGNTSWLVNNIETCLGHLDDLPEVFRDSFRAYFEEMKTRVPQDLDCSLGSHYRIWAVKL